MVTMFGHHAVVDYEVWLRAAKENMNNPERNAQSGIVSSKAYRTADGSGVIVTHIFTNLDAAQKYEKMMQSPETHAMAEKMGAKFPLTIWIAEEVKL